MVNITHILLKREKKEKTKKSLQMVPSTAPTN
jgi:hypothetical protein